MPTNHGGAPGQRGAYVRPREVWLGSQPIGGGKGGGGAMQKANPERRWIGFGHGEGGGQSGTCREHLGEKLSGG